MKSSFLADFKKFAMRGNVIDMAYCFFYFLVYSTFDEVNGKEKGRTNGSCSCPGSFRRGEIVVGNSGLVKEKRRMRRSSFSAKNNNAAFLSEAALLLMTGFINYPMIYLLLGR